jgi:hypothetical protein
MKILVQDGSVFIPYGKDDYLCIGTREEVEGCTKQQLAEMVIVADAIYRFKHLNSLGVTRH